MLSSYLPNFSETTPEEIEKISKECYKAIFPNAEKTVEFDNKGEFIGATIFESFDNIAILFYVWQKSYCFLGNKQQATANRSEFQLFYLLFDLS